MSDALCGSAIVLHLAANALSGVVAQGVNCPMLSGDDGELYALPSLPPALQVGDRVVLETSSQRPPFLGVCDQGKHIHWVRVTRPAANGQPERSWPNPEN